MSPPEPPDPLADLRARIEATREAAERLARLDAPGDAPGAAGAPAGDPTADDPVPGEAPPRIPRQGEGTPGLDGEPSAHDELAALLALLQALRHLVPAELQQQVTDVIRQVLLLLRALIDTLLERLEHLEREPAARGDSEPQVEDIPIT
jgi:hypothetical protein